MRTRTRFRHVVGAVGVVAAVALATSGCLVVTQPTGFLEGARAHDVNDAGIVVGSRWLIEPTISLVDHAYRYDPTTGTVSSLGSLGGESSSALAVNDAGA